MEDGASAIRFLPCAGDEMITVVVEPARAVAVCVVLPQLDLAASDDRAFCAPALLKINKAMADPIGAFLSSLFGDRRTFQQDGCTQLARQARFEEQEAGGNYDAREYDERSTPCRWLTAAEFV